MYLTKDEFNNYINEVNRVYRNSRNVRFGQVLFNVLSNNFASLANMVTDTELDLFYEDDPTSERIVNFYRFLYDFE